MAAAVESKKWRSSEPKKNGGQACMEFLRTYLPYSQGSWYSGAVYCDVGLVVEEVELFMFVIVKLKKEII